MSARPARSEWPLAKRLKNDAIYWIAAAALRGVLRLPRTSLPRLGRAVGGLTHALLGSARRAALDNLRIAYPALDERERRRLARRVFRTLGADLLDTLALLRRDEPGGATLALPDEAAANLARALARGSGVVYVTSHLGPWERMAALLSERGFPITTVARESYDARFQRLLYEPLRAGRGVHAIYRGEPGAPYAILRALRKGRVVGFPIDLPGRVPVAPVRLLGAPSRLPVGPARIALRTRSPIVIGTPAERQKPTSDSDPEELELRIEELDAGDLAPTPAGEAVLLQRMADALSERIRALPAHWPWMHPSFGPFK